MFEITQKYKVIEKYVNFLFITNTHYEKNKLIWKILEKLIEFLEITNFRNLVLKFIFKLMKLNISFVTKFLLSLLKNKSANDFRKVSLLWKCTENVKNDDLKKVL